MARTYGGGREWLPTRGKYPALCDICGVVWKAKDLKRGPDGFFRCPDDADERGAYELDRENARYKPAEIVDRIGPYDPPVFDTSFLAEALPIVDDAAVPDGAVYIDDSPVYIDDSWVVIT